MCFHGTCSSLSVAAQDSDDGLQTFSRKLKLFSFKFPKARVCFRQLFLARAVRSTYFIHVKPSNTFLLIWRQAGHARCTLLRCLSVWCLHYDARVPPGMRTRIRAELRLRGFHKCHSYSDPSVHMRFECAVLHIFPHASS